MPAIHLPHLQQQIKSLSEHYADAEKFSRQLHHLFTYYGDQTYRTGEEVKKAPQLATKNIPAPVLRQIVTQISPYAENAPHAILNLCQELWTHQILEYRLLAAMLLGKISISHAEETLNLIQIWNLENKEEQILKILSANSINNIRLHDSELLLNKIQTWLTPDEETFKAAEINRSLKLGLSALIPFVKDPLFENLPLIYRLIDPLLHQSPKNLRPYLIDLLIPLAERSPKEVAFILRTGLEDEPTIQLKWLGRRILPVLPEENQARLRPLVNRSPDE